MFFYVIIHKLLSYYHAMAMLIDPMITSGIMGPRQGHN